MKYLKCHSVIRVSSFKVLWSLFLVCGSLCSWLLLSYIRYMNKNDSIWLGFSNIYVYLFGHLFFRYTCHEGHFVGIL